MRAFFAEVGAFAFVAAYLLLASIGIAWFTLLPSIGFLWIIGWLR